MNQSCCCFFSDEATTGGPVSSAAIISETELPKNHRILCFLPHPDDVRFIGCCLKTLSLDNELMLIIMASGHHAILKQEMSVEKKKEIRKEEMRAWSETIAISGQTLHFLEAEETYERKTITEEDQDKVTRLIRNENPSMIMIPHRDDVLQAVNRCTRTMVGRGVAAGIPEREQRQERVTPLLILEYPTLYNPFISFKYRNLNVLITDSELSEKKHRANKAFRSLDRTYIDLTERCVEAYDASCLSEYVSQYNSRCTITSHIQCIDARQCRCEHYHISILRHKEQEGTLLLCQQSLEYPLASREKRIYTNGNH